MSRAGVRPYRVEYLVADAVCSADALRRELAASLADEPGRGAIAVAGDGPLIKVHVVTTRPEAALAIGRAAGALLDVIVELRPSAVAHERAA